MARLLGVLLLVLLLPVDRAGALAPDPRPTFTFADAWGQQVTVRVPVRRLVTNNGQVAEILCALGAAEALVGISEHTLKHNTELLTPLRGKQAIGPAANVSVEKVMELQPELVVVYDIWLTYDQLERQLQPLGIPVARLNAYRIDTIRQEIALLGRLVGKEAEAAAYLADFEALVQLVQERLRGLPRPVRAYFESFSDYTTMSAKAPNHELFALAGMVNVAAGLPVPSPRVTPEWVVAANPEVIIKAATASLVKMGFGATDIKRVRDFHEQLCKRPAWQQLAAVKNRRVYLIASEINSGPRLPIGLLYKAKWCHPERFQDVDPEDYHRRWLRRWHHQELRGIYVYP